MKIIDTYHAFAKEMFLEAEVDDDKVIKYKKKDGEPGEMKASSAKTMPKDHPAKVAYDKMTDRDSDSDKPKGQALGGSDFERDGGDDKGGEEPSDAEKLKSLDKKIKKTTAVMRMAASYYNDPREQEYAAKLRKELDQLEAEREKMVADMGGEPEDEKPADEPSDIDPEKPADEPSDMDTEKPVDEPEDEKPVDEPKDEPKYQSPYNPQGMSPDDPMFYDPEAERRRKKRAMNASKDYKIINGKKYKAIQESKKEEKDFTKLLNENYKRFSRK